jgi:hypothetical protein
LDNDGSVFVHLRQIDTLYFKPLDKLYNAH